MGKTEDRYFTLKEAILNITDPQLNILVDE